MELLINGKKHAVKASADQLLLHVLRDELDLTGTKYGCGEGQCGACTVLLDNKAVRSCRTPLSAVQGKEIMTIEGLATNGKLHPVQQAYQNVDVFQCGYCAPGMVMSTVALLRENPNPTEAEIIQFMNGNICRCGTYPKIITAIQEAANA
ncbi:(2Fe-2S)-binding protein [Pontibacter russatus]|uniref:(2Fe-2S)-binding protein n=1 Tax=Pontibacter russatus TaxID=2694929 RepID=UPI00137AB3CF|nr:(2Fe-2S)-binding protein [Pontibacter russatus]